MFHSSVQSTVMQPRSSNVVFLSLYRKVLFAPSDTSVLKKHSERRRPRRRLYKLQLSFLQSLLHPEPVRGTQVMSGCSSLRWPAALYHSAEGGGAVRRHAGGGLAVDRGVWPHQEGAAIYGVLSLLCGRWQVWQGSRGVRNIGRQPVSQGVHLARHHGDSPVS